jgi:magnesium transporter
MNTTSGQTRGRAPDQEEAIEQALEFVENRAWRDLRRYLAGLHPPDIGELIRLLDPPHRIIVFRMLPRAVADEVFSYLPPEEEVALLAELTDEETQRVINELEPDERTSLLTDLPGQAVQRLLNMLSREEVEKARLLLGYPEESVGRLMTPEYVAVRAHWTVAQALDHIRRYGREVESLWAIYVTDARWHLLDDLPLERFVLADPGERVEKVMDRRFVAAQVLEDREDAVRVMQQHDLAALPVVDVDGVLLGVVTVDDILDVAQAEATEDFHKVGGLAPLRHGYARTSVWVLYRKRIGWLSFLIVISLVSSGVIAAYEDTLTAAIALAFFIPLLIGSGGNTGAQSATLMVRAIATGDLNLRQWSAALLKEVMVGVLLAGTMGAFAGVLGLVRGGLGVGIVVALAMGATVLTANLLGTLLPFLLTRFRLDPAVASSPLITTVVDAAGLLLYFGIASRLLPLLS